jgi:hypothetical protein
MLLSHTSLKENELASQSKHQKYEESLRRDDHSAFHAAFAAGFRQPDPRIHRDQLPPPPYNWTEAQRHPRRDGFIAAAQREYQALESKGTFRKASRPPGVKIIPLTWVFTYKFDADGYLITEKARICVRGDLQPLLIHVMKVVVVVQHSKRTS